MTQGSTIGISFGSCYSCISILQKDGSITTIANEDGYRQIPSIVSFTNAKEILCGSQAKSQLLSNAPGTVLKFKNILGLDFDHQLVQTHSTEFKTTIVNRDSVPNYQISNENDEGVHVVQYYTSTQITTLYLKKLKETAESHTSTNVTGCIVSVPPHFTAKQKECLVKSCADAGFTNVIPLSEPIAALMAFDMSNNSKV